MSETVLAYIDRDHLSAALAHFHRNGYGHVIKVMDPQRSPLADQLRRAGVACESMSGRPTDTQVLLFVPAPQRSLQAAGLAHAVGVSSIEIVDCGDPVTWSLPETLRTEALHRKAKRHPHLPTEVAPLFAD